MSLSCVILVVSMLRLGATVYSQDVKVSIHTDNMSLEQLFADIEQQTDVKFLYSRENVSDITVKVDADDMQLSDLLNSVLFSNGLQYVERDENLIAIDCNDAFRNILVACNKRLRLYFARPLPVPSSA